VSQWDYGGIHRAYDMSGIIEMPNNSRVMVCDWMKELPDFMLEADTIFVDPPWNEGNAKTFYTKADQLPPLYFNFVKFSETLFERIGEIGPKFLFIEMGKEWLGRYLEECRLRYRYVTFYNSTYYKKRENKCYVIHATNDAKRRRYKALEDMDEAAIIEWLCANHQYECIGDLCMGRGLVGKHAFLNGKRFVGTELNPKRLAVLVDFITQKSKKASQFSISTAKEPPENFEQGQASDSLTPFEVG
jgi:hypothetical protein